jgi:hypothetical protein
METFASKCILFHFSCDFVVVFENLLSSSLGHAVAQLIDALGYKPERHKFDSRHWHLH